MATAQQKREARKAIENHGTIDISYNDGIDCEDELRTIGVNLDLVHGCLHQIDYYTCSIKYDNEYHLAEELEEEHSKLCDHLDIFDIDYDIN